MDFAILDSTEIADFRREFRAWLDVHAPREVRIPPKRVLTSPATSVWAQSFQRTLTDAGWAAPSWPRRYGGGGLSRSHDRVVQEEQDQAAIPMLYEHGREVAAAVLSSGSEGQRTRFVRALLRGDITCCRSLDDSDAIADPETAPLRAARMGDAYLVTGQAIFAGTTAKPDYLWSMAATYNDGTTTRSVSAFLIPANLDGIGVVPAESVTSSFNCRGTFTDVVVPVEYRIGGEGDGHSVAARSFRLDDRADHIAAQQRTVVSDLVSYTAETLKAYQPVNRYREVREQVVQAYINTQILRLLSLRNRWLQEHGEQVSYQGAQYVGRALAMQSILASTLLDTLGPLALVTNPESAPFAGAAEAVERGVMVSGCLTDGPMGHAQQLAHSLQLSANSRS